MRRVTLQTWNMFGAAQDLRSFLRWRGIPDAHRLAHPEVVSQLHGTDVVCLQELFLEETADFFHALPYPHKTRDHNKATLWPLTVAGSGLGIASRFPLVEHAIRPFRRPHVGAERFARKGVMWARLLVSDAPRVELDVVTTHLQSGYDAKARRVRERQLAELRALVDEVGSPDRAFVVAGDLNIDGLATAREVGGEYAALRSAFDGFEDLGAKADHATFDPHPERNALAHRFESGGSPQRIDYVLFRPAATGHVEPERFDLVLHLPLVHERGPMFASDHYGLQVTMRTRAA